MKIRFRKFILPVCIFFMGLALLVAVPGAQAVSFRPEKSLDGDVNAILVDSTNKVFLIASDPRNEF